MEKKKKNHTVPLITLRYSAPPSALGEVGVVCAMSQTAPERRFLLLPRGVPAAGGQLCPVLAGLEGPGSCGGCFGGDGGRAEPCSMLTSAPMHWVSLQGARGAGLGGRQGLGLGCRCRHSGCWVLTRFKCDVREKRSRSCTALLGRQGDDEQCLSNNDKIPGV